MSFEQQRLFRAYTVDIDNGHSWTLTAAQPANLPFWSISIVADGTHPVNVQLNADSATNFVIPPTGSFNFTDREFDVTSVRLQHSASGAGTCEAQVIASCLGGAPTAVLV